MKRYLGEFCRRGFIACGFGPLVLAVFYLILQEQTGLQIVSIKEVCIGIFSLSALSFMAGGMNAVYQIEQIPLMVAILIHGSVLYVCYLITYLINGWLKWGSIPILVFSGIFILGYFTIWAIIYAIIRRNTERINGILEAQRMNPTP